MYIYTGTITGYVRIVILFNQLKCKFGFVVQQKDGWVHMSNVLSSDCIAKRLLIVDVGGMGRIRATCAVVVVN